MKLPVVPRRTVLTTAAWTAPAVVLATGAPAFATSGATTLLVNPGATRIGTVHGNSLGPIFDGFSIQPSANLGVGDLTVTLTASSPTTAAYLYHYPFGITGYPGMWVTQDAYGTILPSLTFVFPHGVGAGTTIPLTGGLALIYGPAYEQLAEGTLTITVAATGATPTALTFNF